MTQLFRLGSQSKQKELRIFLKDLEAFHIYSFRFSSRSDAPLVYASIFTSIPHRKN